MIAFLLWRPKTPCAPAASVVDALRDRFAPLLAREPNVNTRSVGPVRLDWIELPVDGFTAASFEEKDGCWALAPDYPLNARRLVRSRRTTAPPERTLLDLAEDLERDAEALVAELIPPSCLIWSRGESVRLGNDGLGQSQLFEYEDEHIWAVTNRVSALPVLGVDLVPVREDWAARMVTNWFPLHRSGFEGVTLLAGGSQLEVTHDGVHRRRFDPIGMWLNPEPVALEARLERGRQALLDTLSDATEVCERPTLGLSGGWDSRAVAACLRALGADFRTRVRGQGTHFDVIVSAELARIAGLPHRVKSGGGIPSGSAAGCRSSILKALVWQGGYFATKKHKTFLARDDAPLLDGGAVNVMGQHAGLGKADFVKLTGALQKPGQEAEDLLVAHLLEEAPPNLLASSLDAAQALIRQSFRVAHEYGKQGLDALLFFYLHEFTRRWGSATVASQPGLVVAPFLCPEMIRACAAFSAEELTHKPIHAFTTTTLAPDWADVPYADQVSEADLHSGRLSAVATASEGEDEANLPRWRRVRHHRKYHYKYFWKDVGQPLLDEAYREGGFWTELFESRRRPAVELAKRGAADGIVVAHLLTYALKGDSTLSNVPS